MESCNNLNPENTLQSKFLSLVISNQVQHTFFLKDNSLIDCKLLYDSYSFFSASRPSLYNGMPAHFADSPELEAIYKMLSVTQPPPTPEVITKQYRPASVVDKAHINGRYIWNTPIIILNSKLHFLSPVPLKFIYQVDFSINAP